MNFALNTAFTVSHRFVVFSFSLVSMHILISFFDFFCDFLVIQQRIVQPPYVGIFNMLSAAAKSLQSCLTLCNPIDGQPTRLPRPWDSPGKNNGMGCHFLLQCMKVKSESEVAQSCPTLNKELQPTRLLRPWDFPGKSTGVGCHCLLQICYLGWS